jgi:hypothetical protein
MNLGGGILSQRVPSDGHPGGTFGGGGRPGPQTFAHLLQHLTHGAQAEDMIFIRGGTAGEEHQHRGTQGMMMSRRLIDAETFGRGAGLVFQDQAPLSVRLGQLRFMGPIEHRNGRDGQHPDPGQRTQKRREAEHCCSTHLLSPCPVRIYRDSGQGDANRAAEFKVILH